MERHSPLESLYNTQIDELLNKSNLIREEMQGILEMSKNYEKKYEEKY